MIPDNHNHFLMAGGVQPMLDAAARAGLDEIVFAEHVFHIEEARTAHPYLAGMTPEGEPLPHRRYVDAILEAAARHDVAVGVGIEMDAVPEDAAFEAAMAAFRDGRESDWDVVLGSVHAIRGGTNIHVPPVIDAAEAWDDYLGRLEAAVESGRYDVVTHPVRLGIAVRDGEGTGMPARLDELARRAADAGVALEVNGSDHRHRPDLVGHLVRACVRRGTVVSLGSDAHLPNRVGGVRAALPLLREAGVERVARFRRRVLELVPLPA